ncbi:hypothetical protein F2Q70_00037262 [Brassica cretica]|uniref:Uncharacterized protein n=1 Tax=Brassica cretica TaxID=69181 RepID=A0A8S9JUC7_BRACR|nr:hypothetical protein F2Q70_00037262 [Brassica cretica]KAF3532749.1 hypothetical protein DY000_02042921 [Brassica cretica]
MIPAITVGEKYSGIEFLQIPGRTPASGSPLEGTPVLRIPAGRNSSSQDPYWKEPRFPIMEFFGFGLRIAPLPPGNGKLPIRRTFHISEYGRV